VHLHHQFGSVFNGTSTPPGRYYLSPGNRDTKGYGLVEDGCNLNLLGEPTGACGVATDPNAGYDWKDHEVILRSIRTLPRDSSLTGKAGTLLIRDRVTNSILIGAVPRRHVPLEMLYGPNGISLGTAPYIQWLPNTASDTLDLEVVYDIA